MSGLSPNLTVAEQIDKVCDQFEAQWDAAGAGRIEELLAAAAEPLRGALLRALLLVELELRARSGKTLSAEEYYQRFPGYKAVLDSVLLEAGPSASVHGSTGNRSVQNTVSLTAHPSDTSQGPNPAA